MLSIHYIFLIIIAGTYATGWEDDIQFIQELGLLLEKDFHVYGYDQMVTIPVVYSIPIKPPSFQTTSKCKRVVKSQIYYDMMKNKMERLIPEDMELVADPGAFDQRNVGKIVNIASGNYNIGPTLQEREDIRTLDDIYGNRSSLSQMKRRTKRMATLAIGGIAALGLLITGFIWNKAEIAHAQSNIDELRRAQGIIDKNVEDLYSVVNNIINDTNSLFHIVSDSTYKINEVISHINCGQVGVTTIENVMDNWLRDGPSSFIRALNGALVGQVTIDLIPKNFVLGLIKGHPVLSKTLLLKKPLLLYSLGRFQIIHVTAYPPSITGLLIMPILTQKPLGKFYNTYSCLKPINGSILNIPSSIVRSTEGHRFWVPASNDCSLSFDIRICKTSQLLSRNEVCLKSLIDDNNFKGCSTLPYISNPDPEVIATQNGYLLCSISDSIHIVEKDSSGTTIARQIDEVSRPLFLGGKNLTSMTYRNMIYYPPTILEGINITYHTVDPSSDHGSLDPVTLPSNWIPLVTVTPRPYPSDLSSHNIATYTLIFFIFVLFGVLSYVVYISVVQVWLRTRGTHKKDVELTELNHNPTEAGED